MAYEYDCPKRGVQLLQEDDITARRGKYYIVECSECCTTPVYHLLRDNEKDYQYPLDY